MQNIYGNYSGLVTSPYWQKKHDVMLIQVRIFSGKQNNPSITWEWPGRDPVWSDAWEASSNFRKNFLKFLPIDTFCNAAGDSVGQEQPAMNVIFLDSLKKTLLCMQALLATHPAEQELSPMQHSGDYHLQFLSSDSNSRKNTCKSRGVPPPTRRGLFLLSPRLTQPGQGLELPWASHWIRSVLVLAKHPPEGKSSCMVLGQRPHSQSWAAREKKESLCW